MRPDEPFKQDPMPPSVRLGSRRCPRRQTSWCSTWALSALSMRCRGDETRSTSCGHSQCRLCRGQRHPRRVGRGGLSKGCNRRTCSGELLPSGSRFNLRAPMQPLSLPLANWRIRRSPRGRAPADAVRVPRGRCPARSHAFHRPPFGEPPPARSCHRPVSPGAVRRLSGAIR
jgi:hypothetical protein